MPFTQINYGLFATQIAADGLASDGETKMLDALTTLRIKLDSEGLPRFWALAQESQTGRSLTAAITEIAQPAGIAAIESSNTENLFFLSMSDQAILKTIAKELFKAIDRHLAILP